MKETWRSTLGTSDNIKLTQSVIISRFEDEFGFDGGGTQKSNTSAIPGSVLAK